MPELPEVESLRRGLVRAIVGSKILAVKVLNEKIISGKGTKRYPDKTKTKEFSKNIIGKKIVSIERRAKNLIIRLSTKEILLVHLKMTGQLVFVPKNKKSKISFGGHPIQESEISLPHKHTYIIFSLSNGTLYYNDVRQFGYVLYYKNIESLDVEKHFDDLGLEPFDKKFTFSYFKEKLRNKTTPIKKLLLDQSIVVGCGNIYCDEVFWASSVLPTRPGRSLKEGEIEKVYKNIKRILDKAINSGGSSVANYLLADGKRGNYTDYHKVYKMQNKKCSFPKCTGVIKKINFAGRGTHFCPVHQK